MSYIKKGRRPRRRRGMGDLDPWASSPTPDIGTPTTPPTGSEVSSLLNIFGSAGSSAVDAVTGTAPGALISGNIGVSPSGNSGPSTISQVGSGVASFLTALAPKQQGPLPYGYPGMPGYPQPGMSPTTMLMLGGGALLLLLLATRD